MIKKISLKSKKLRLIVFILLFLIILTFIVNGLRKRKAINSYRQGIELLRWGNYETAIEKLQKSMNFWPRGWWYADAQKKLFYCKLNTGEDIEKLLVGVRVVGQEGKVAENITLKILFFFILIGIGFVVFIRIKKKKKIQQFTYYIQSVGKRIKTNLPPICLESSKDGFSSVKDYQEYVTYCKEGEFVKLAECLIGEYYMKDYPDAVDYLDKAIESYKSLLNNYPNSIFAEEILYKLANLCFFRLNDYDEAIKGYKTIIEKYPETKWVKIAKARVGLIEDNSDYGRQPLSIYISAEKYYENKKYEKTIDEFRKVISKFPDSNLAGDALYAIGDVYIYKINKPESATREYRQLIDKYPQSKYAPNAQYKIGECRRRLKKFAEAISEYKKFIDNYPDSDFLDYGYYYLAQCYEHEKKPNQAEKFYQKLLDDYPGSIWVVVATSRLEVLRGANKDKEE